MSDLEATSGLPARTIRYYITQGLLPPAHGRGPSATYDLGHLLRLQAVVGLKERGQPLNEIRESLAHLSDDDIAAMLRVETSPRQERWRRIALHPDVELHVREPEGRRRDAAMDRAIARIERIVQDELGRVGDW